MYLMYVATVLVLSVYVVMYFVYGYRVSPLLHCISVLYKCYVHYITALLTGFLFVFCFFGRARQNHFFDHSIV